MTVCIWHGARGADIGNKQYPGLRRLSSSLEARVALSQARGVPRAEPDQGEGHANKEDWPSGGDSESHSNTHINRKSQPAMSHQPMEHVNGSHVHARSLPMAPMVTAHVACQVHLD